MEFLRLMIAQAIAKLMRKYGPNTAEHTAGFATVQQKIGALDPSKIRGVVFFAMVEQDGGVDMVAIAEGPKDVVELTMEVGKMELLQEDIKREALARTEGADDDCQCPMCQLRRAITTRGAEAGVNIEDVQVIAIGPDTNISDIIKEVTSQRSRPSTH